MTRMVHTPLLVDQLNQVITVLRFDDLGNLSRLQIGQCVRKLPHEPVQRLGVSSPPLMAEPSIEYMRAMMSKRVCP